MKLEFSSNSLKNGQNSQVVVEKGSLDLVKHLRLYRGPMIRGPVHEMVRSRFLLFGIFLIFQEPDREILDRITSY